MRRSILLPALLLLWTVAETAAQPETDPSGYVEAIPALQGREGSALMRLRFRPSLLPGGDTRITIEYEADAFYHSAPALFSPPEANLRRQVVDLFWIPVNENRFALYHFIDRLYFRRGFQDGEVIVGRQRVAWGTGRIWNPTDLFNPVAPTTFAKIEKDGVDAVTAKIAMGSFTDLSLVCNPQRRWDVVNAGARFRSNVSGYDLSLMSGVFDRRFTVGGDLAGSLFGAGIRGEGILTGRSGRAVARYIAGVDYQFTPDLYALLEFQFNGAGAVEPNGYDLQALARGEILNVGRRYLATQVSWLVHPLITAAGTGIVNLGDGSGFGGILVSWSAADEIAVSFGGQVFLGDRGDEYAFPSDVVYVKAEGYF